MSVWYCSLVVCYFSLVSAKLPNTVSSLVKSPLKGDLPNILNGFGKHFVKDGLIWPIYTTLTL
jgi:hypothetical protein